ncbi:ribonuclease J [Candidatus Saccharibacteria bacterium]|nr:ribonuclease J [Candidatus Saccharibacteria bacterium]
MGQRRVTEARSDDLSKRPNGRRKTGNSVLDATTTRKGEVLRAARRTNENVNLQAGLYNSSDTPVNKSIYNGFNGEQYASSLVKKSKDNNQLSLKVIPIGGTQIGRNTTALCYGDEIIVIDMGFEFPGDDYPGINYIVPDISWLEERKDQIKAVVFTHAHLDHIGAFHHMIPKIPAPVYATKFTIAMLKKNMEEEDTNYEPEYHELVPERHDRVQLSQHFSLELVRVNHSIPDCACVVIRTPVGVVVSSGDWRFQEDPLDGRKFDMERLTEIATKEGVQLLINESTNCEVDGSNDSKEAEVRLTFNQVMGMYPNSRIIISTFSSQIHRLQVAIGEAIKYGRKVAVAGYSMINNVEIALRTGDLKVPAGALMKLEDIIKLPDGQVCILCTGNQGELNAVLNRMANGAHRYIKIKNSDIIVLSSSRIPGNEGHVAMMEDNLIREGCDVISKNNNQSYNLGPVHLGGHGHYDDHVKFITALNPKFYLPNHGDFTFLEHNARIAEKECGIPRKNIFVCDAGDVVELFHDGTARRGARVHSGSVMYDDAGAIVSEVVLKDRIHMSTEGIFVVVLTVQRGTGRLLSSPDIISRGFIYLRDSEELITSIRTYAKQKAARAYTGRRLDIESFKRDLRDDITQILYDRTQRTPIVIPVVNEIGSPNSPAARRAETEIEARDRSFEQQEMARIRGQGPAGRFTSSPRKKPNHHSPARNTVNNNIDTTAHPNPAPKKPEKISFKKTPQGPNPMRMWREY